MSQQSSSGHGKRTRLSPSVKYEIFVNVLTGQSTQREAAEKFKVDRSTVVHVCRVAKQGALDALAVSVPGRRSSKRAEQIKLELAPAGLVGGRDRSWPPGQCCRGQLRGRLVDHPEDGQQRDRHTG